MKRDDYYSAREAQKVLGLDKAMFHRRVNEGVIKKIIPPGYKQGLYLKRDIDALALSMHWLFEHNEHFVFSKSTPGDQVEEMDIGIRCFGAEYITPLPERIAFQQKNEYTFWSLKVDGKVVGYVSLFRFPPEFLDDILTGKHIERDITTKEVLPFERLQPFSIYIDVMAVDPRLPAHLRKLYGGIIAARLANTILNLIDSGFQIQKVYTVTATPEGDNLVNEAGFQIMEGKSQAPSRIAYEFDVSTKEGIEQLKRQSRRFHYAHSRTEDQGSPR